MSGFGPLGTLAFGELPLSAQEIGSLANFQFSTGGFTSSPSDATLPNVHFDGRLVQPLDFRRSMFTGDRIGGQSLPGVGNILIANNDGEFDSMLVRATPISNPSFQRYAKQYVVEERL